jgi:hypothetical protein
LKIIYASIQAKQPHPPHIKKYGNIKRKVASPPPHSFTMAAFTLAVMIISFIRYRRVQEKHSGVSPQIVLFVPIHNPAVMPLFFKAMPVLFMQ